MLWCPVWSSHCGHARLYLGTEPKYTFLLQVDFVRFDQRHRTSGSKITTYTLPCQSYELIILRILLVPFFSWFVCLVGLRHGGRDVASVQPMLSLQAIQRLDRDTSIFCMTILSLLHLQSFLLSPTPDYKH